MPVTKQNIVAMANVVIVGFLLFCVTQCIVRLVALLHITKGSPTKEMAKSGVTLSDLDPHEQATDAYFLGEWLNR